MLAAAALIERSVIGGALLQRWIPPTISAIIAAALLADGVYCVLSPAQWLKSDWTTNRGLPSDLAETSSGRGTVRARGFTSIGGGLIALRIAVIAAHSAWLGS